MGWYNSNWQYRKEITIDSAQVDADLTDFPVYFQVTGDSDLASNAQSSGDDILFTAGDGTTKLDHEIEGYDGTNGDLYAHVEAPSLSASSDTTLYVYYGNPDAANQENATGVWSNGYEVVWHLDEEVSGTGNTDAYKDSTANNYHADDYASATGQSGQLYEGQEFDGSDDYIDGGLGSDNLLSDVTVTVWANKSNWGSSNRAFVHALDDDVATSPEKPIQLEVWDSGTLRHARGDAAGGILEHDVSGFSGFHQVGWKQSRVDSTTVDVSMIVDGSVVNSTSGDYEDVNLTRNHLGAYLGGSDYYWSGYMDELRVSSVSRSSGWSTTTHNNQSSPSTFYTVSAQQTESTSVSESVTITASTTTSATETGRATEAASAAATTTASVTDTARAVESAEGSASASVDATETGTAVDGTTITAAGSTTLTERARAIDPVAIGATASVTATDTARAVVAPSVSAQAAVSATETGRATETSTITGSAVTAVSEAARATEKSTVAVSADAGVTDHAVVGETVTVRAVTDVTFDEFVGDETRRRVSLVGINLVQRVGPEANRVRLLSRAYNTGEVLNDDD